jgi:phosphoribosylaminoimidazole carboxylase PurE protein
VEKSKEGFRQFLLQHFPDPDVFTNKDRMKERAALAKNTALPTAALLEVSKTYTDIAEKIIGQKLTTTQRPREEIIEVLDKQFGLIDRNQEPLVLIAAGSDSDMPHLETLKKEVGKFKIDAEIRICSAHKQPGRLEGVIAQYNKSRRPIMLVGCAGGTDALSGTASYLSNFPVVSCPPDGMNQTCLTNPPGSSNAFIVKPANIGKFAAQMFARSSAAVAEALNANIAEKITKLEDADAKLTGKAVDTGLPRFEPAMMTGSGQAPLVVIAAGSDSDMPHLETLQKELAKFKIDSEIRICSAHKQPGRLQAVIAEYSAYAGPLMLIGCAGGTDALSGTASYLANFPVVSCPPDGMNNSCLTNPPGSSNAFIVKPANVAKFAAQMFSRSSKEISTALAENTSEKIRKLEEADEKLRLKRLSA